MKTFNVIADQGSVRIKLDGGAVFLNNGIGDGGFQVHVYEPGERMETGQEIAGYFHISPVHTGSIMHYDCELPADREEVLHTLNGGRYYAIHNNDGDVFIMKFSD